MSEREFLERVQDALIAVADRLEHSAKGLAGVCVSTRCEKCRLLALADEATERARLAMT